MAAHRYNGYDIAVVLLVHALVKFKIELFMVVPNICNGDVVLSVPKPFDDVVFVEWLMESIDSEFKLIYVPAMDCVFAGLFADKEQAAVALESFYTRFTRSYLVEPLGN